MSSEQKEMKKQERKAVISPESREKSCSPKADVKRFCFKRRRQRAIKKYNLFPGSLSISRQVKLGRVLLECMSNCSLGAVELLELFILFFLEKS